MTTIIGTLRDTPLDCGPDHLPGCFNAALDKTWCICGEATWPGDTGTWHSVARYAPQTIREDSRAIGIGAVGLRDTSVIVGWDTYWMEAGK